MNTASIHYYTVKNKKNLFKNIRKKDIKRKIRQKKS